MLNFIFLQCSKAEIWTPHFKYYNAHYKSLNHSSMTTLIICFYVLNWDNHAKLYLPSTFQTSDVELLSPKIETKYTSG